MRVPDGGEADLYARGDGAWLSSVIISRFSRGAVLDLLVEFVRRSEAVILPPGYPTMLIDEAQRRHLPDELRADAVLVSSGADIETALSFEGQHDPRQV